MKKIIMLLNSVFLVIVPFTTSVVSCNTNKASLPLTPQKMASKYDSIDVTFIGSDNDDLPTNKNFLMWDQSHESIAFKAIFDKVKELSNNNYMTITNFEYLDNNNYNVVYSVPDQDSAEKEIAINYVFVAEKFDNEIILKQEDNTKEKISEKFKTASNVFLFSNSNNKIDLKAQDFADKDFINIKSSNVFYEDFILVNGTEKSKVSKKVHLQRDVSNLDSQYYIKKVDDDEIKLKLSQLLNVRESFFDTFKSSIKIEPNKNLSKKVTFLNTSDNCWFFGTENEKSVIFTDLN